MHTDLPAQPTLSSRLLLLPLICWLLLALAPPGAQAGPDQPPPLPPTYRIAYLETGPYWSYTSTFDRIKTALQTRGWAERVVFPSELHFSLGWGKEARLSYRQKVRAILQRDDYDLLLSFGTEATQAVLAENTRKHQIIGCSLSNPIAAGITPSATDSGAENFTTALNEQAAKQFFLLFYRIAKFKKLGIMYNDTVAGRIYSYLDDAREVGRDLGFTVLEYDKLGAEETLEDCLQGARTLQAQGVDALFISNLNCVDLQTTNPYPLYKFLFDKKIVTCANDDRDQVKRFAMMGMSQFDEAMLADFHAGQIIEILAGKQAGKLSMIVPFNYKIFLNLEAASRLGISFDLNALTIADEIYLEQAGMHKTAGHD